MRNEDKAYVVASQDPNFIRRIRKVPVETERVYFKGFSLRVPKGSTIGHVAEILAVTTNSSVVDNLKLRRTWEFSGRQSQAMRFPYNEINEEVERLRRTFEDSSLHAEMLEEEYLPF